MGKNMDWRKAKRDRSGRTPLHEKMNGVYSRAEVRRHERLESAADAFLAEAQQS